MKIRYFDTLESTNNYCKLLNLKSVEEFTVIYAGKQSAGIGQQGNVWVSEPYKNLTFSLILKPSFLSASDQYQLTMMLAVATAETVSTCLPHCKTSIKWPNDIYVDDNKICGILTTCRIQNGQLADAICGIGLNVNQTEFPSWLPNPVSMKAIDNKEHDISSILTLLLTKIQEQYYMMQSDSATLRARYLSLLYRRGIEASYRYQGHTIQATITGINSFGHLLLTSSSGETLCCDLKEIQFIK